MLTNDDREEIRDTIRKAVRRHELEAIFIHTPVILIVIFVGMWLFN